jgi:hypothetical protein
MLNAGVSFARPYQSGGFVGPGSAGGAQHGVLQPNIKVDVFAYTDIRRLTRDMMKSTANHKVFFDFFRKRGIHRK